MAICRRCGAEFDVDDARSEFNSNPEFTDIDYDDQFPGGDYCYDCAEELTIENLDAGAALMFELETGRPREDRDDLFNW